MEFRVEGLEKVLKKLSPEILAEPLRRGLGDLVDLAKRKALERVPTHKAGLRAGIQRGVSMDTSFVPLWSKLSAGDIKYAHFVELGTRPHWVKKGVLADWAAKHGMPESAVRWSIAKHGTSRYAQSKYGTKGFEMFKQAKEAVEGKMESIARRILKEIGDKFGD